MRARRTSPMGMIPSFSPAMGSENSEKASRISDSSSAVILCSFASLDGRTPVLDGAPAAAAAAVEDDAGGRRRGGYREMHVNKIIPRAN